ncbi:hypothetical protein H072_4341 [Dactylellina haptotyla CBS 200.50]|uniref:Uncharacterized protein n=1 Tax=Dactylellina haptotyla (strain CBS 200.50) TaxID=1284197 RepID=S8AFS8_DACHA|nr:hypothetical protein H072_4341 [Dactylellina haptotyla CBS 200.50]
MLNKLSCITQALAFLALCQQAASAPVALSTVWEVVTITSCAHSACAATKPCTTSELPPVTSTTTVTSCSTFSSPSDTTLTTSIVSSSTEIESSTLTSTSEPTSTPPGNPYRDRNFNTIKHIYNLTIFPNQVPIIAFGGSAVPDGLFADHASGRISPVGNFTDFEDSIEYFFALPPLPISNKNSAAFTRFELAQFSSECPEIASSTVYLYASVVNETSPDNGKLVTILKQTGFWRFNTKGEVINYDLALIEVDHFIEELTSTDYTDPAAQAELIATTCNAQALRCVGVNSQYDSIDHCIEVLSAKPFGSYTDIWSDSVVCRSIHIVLTLVRPDAHCPHVGPTGGMKCVDFDYKTRQFDDQRLWGQTDLFRCPGVPAY